MKRIVFFALIASCFILTDCMAQQAQYPGKNNVIAHRGAWKDFNTAQNSIEALKGAITLNCFGSETDVQMTADGKLVINHDNEWGSMSVQKTSLSKLRSVPLSNGEKLPLLKDFLKIIKRQSGTKLILELKPSIKGKQWSDQTVKKTVALVKRLHTEKKVIYISFSYDMCKEILRLVPDAKVQFLGGNVSPEQLKKDGLTGADYHYSIFLAKHPDWIAELRSLNLVSNVWTVDNIDDIRSLLKQNVGYITTNEPKLILNKLKK